MIYLQKKGEKFTAAKKIYYNKKQERVACAEGRGNRYTRLKGLGLNRKAKDGGSLCQTTMCYRRRALTYPTLHEV